MPVTRFSNKAQRFVVVSGYFPPVIGGTSTVMRNLLSAFRPETFSIVSESVSSFDGEHNAPVSKDLKISRIGVSPFVRKIPYGAKLSRYLRFGLIPLIERQICASAWAVQAERLVAVYPSWPFLIAAYRAHRRLKIPLITYYMDVSADASQLRWPDRPAVQRYERKILQEATQRLVLSEAIADDYKERFSLDSVVIRHSIDSSAMPVARELPQAASWKGKNLIVHTGVVEDSLQREGLKRIATVIHQHPEWNAKLILSTPTDKEDLRASGFDLPCVETISLEHPEVITLQRMAKVLVAVLPFQGRIQAYQRTAFPTKAIEYMTSNVPIMAHAPADSFFGRHVRQYGYACPADTEDLDKLAGLLSSLINDADLRQRLTAQAAITLKAFFDLPKVAQQFVDACGLDDSVLKPS